MSDMKGTNVMLGLLIEQYQGSPLLIQYLKAYSEEFDTLFDDIRDVYFGRFLDVAVGVQLDIIGDILGTNRRLAVQKDYFGFKDEVTGIPALGAVKLADYATPTDGGLFKSATEAGFAIDPLTDEEFRGVLLGKAFLLNKDSIDINTMYDSIAIAIRKVPANWAITQDPDPALRIITCTIPGSGVTPAEVGIISYMQTFLVPTGTEFLLSIT